MGVNYIHHHRNAESVGITAGVVLGGDGLVDDAATRAIFGMGSDMDNSRLNGGNRFFGTLFGGLLGMGLFRLYILFYPDGSKHFLLLLL